MAYPPAPAPQPAPKQGNGFGVTALVLGIIALVLGFIPIINFVAFVLAPLAIIFAIVGLVVGNKRGSGKGLSITGLITGILSLVVTIGMYVFVFNELGNACEEEGYSGNATECIEEINSEIEDLETM
ncbi:MAG TPA: hypothetical protein VKZ65_13435 [Glycomyces sp.]|nr:hypothetical protein [Glycomyces sp.]